MKCLWYYFANVLQKHLDFVMLEWNTHTIGKFWHDTASERPNTLFFRPKQHGGVNNLMLNISNEKIQHDIFWNNRSLMNTRIIISMPECHLIF